MSGPKVSVRLVAPFSMRCLSCHQFLYKGTKFNARKINTGQKYLNIPIVQLSFKCLSCSAGIILHTDPKNGDYTIAKGADRNLDLRIEDEAQQTIIPLIQESGTIPETQMLKDRSQRAPELSLKMTSPGNRIRKQLPKPKARKYSTKKLCPQGGGILQ